MILNITDAKYIDGFTVKLYFNNGKEKIVDLQNYIYSKKHPFFQPLKNVEIFKNFKIHKTLIWDTGADIAPEYLYNL
ncbi:MAG: DUF2442 domain-containing protein [Campylobacterales bacterium]|nr:DUF2442 domain-containing protein [Campylobacterales bacterium]